MKIQIIGGGGREHALAWKLSQSPLVEKIICAPGNAGIGQLAKCFNVKADDFDGQICLAKKQKVDLVIVGPEQPLVMGIVDELKKQNIPVFGPDKSAAQIEGSKIFCKNLLASYNIPTARFAEFNRISAANDFIQTSKFPIVIKADGLASGKGVIIAKNIQEGLKAVDDLMVSRPGQKIIIEEFLIGQECSLLVLTNGKNIVPLMPARDYKRAFNNDQGPNTGGMGSYSPLPDVPETMVRTIIETIIKPTLGSLRDNGIIYRGILYAGLMLTKNGPQVLEYNCRFGDPETQVILPLLHSDLMELLLATINGTLDKQQAIWHARKKAVGIVLASRGYPEKYQTGYTITGLNDSTNDSLLFHAGTDICKKKILTSGGRVLNVVGLGNDFPSARSAAYNRIRSINFEGMFYRTDIAKF